jgi:hypothetical protein
MSEPQLVFTKHSLTDKWKSQITEAFAACRTNQDANHLYKRIFHFYFIRKFHDPGYNEPEYQTWKQVRDYISEALRRRFATFAGYKDTNV